MCCLLVSLVDHFVEENFKNIFEAEIKNKLKEATISAVIENLHLYEDDLWEKYREREKKFFSEDVQKHIQENIQSMGLDSKELWNAAVFCVELARWFVSDIIPKRKPSLRECAKDALQYPQEELESITLTYKGADGKSKKIVYEIGNVYSWFRAPIVEQMHGLLSGIADSDMKAYTFPAIEWKPKHKNDDAEVTKLVAFTKTMQLVVSRFRSTRKKGNMMRLIAALAHVMGYLEDEKYLTGEYRNKNGKMRPFDSDQELHSLIKNKRAHLGYLLCSGLFQPQK